MQCPACIKRGRPDYFASEPQCAFESGVFDKENWMCATANAVRALCWEDSHVPEGARLHGRYEDESVGLIFHDGRWIAMEWYKERGQCKMIRWVESGKPITLEEATALLLGYDLELLREGAPCE